ncbi:MAG: sigma-54-dependent transcriptional regulator [Phycisphaerae bacterium]
MGRILVVDDQDMMRDGIAATLVRDGHEVIAATDGPAALSRLEQGRFDMMLTDLKMPKMTGIELLAEARKKWPDVPVVLMTAFATVQTAVEAMKLGAYDYIQKPFHGEEIRHLVERTLEHNRLRAENRALRSLVDMTPRPMIGESEVMRAVRQKIKQVGPSSATVLIRGESGTGKEVVARQVHQNSTRNGMPMLAVNCAALSENLLESELFGHEKGAFTGADKMRRGRFELADGGTLLLDEISEIAPSLQAKLLRVLQENQFERVGSSSTITVDVRVIATSNRDLEQCVRDGTFREDLFYRLHVVPIDLPPLRDRPDDVPDLCRHFLHAVAKRERSAFRHIEADAVRALQRYHWPGNVRELQNIIERAVVLEEEPGVIRAQTIEPWLKPDAGKPRGEGTTFIGKPLADVEKQIILETLERFRGHRIKTASALGIGVRTLGMKLKKWKDEGELVPS